MSRIIFLAVILSSCSLIHEKYEYGMLSPNDLRDGELQLTSQTIEKEKCSKFALLIPIGEFNVDEIDKTIAEMLKARTDYVALGNVTQEIRVKGFPPFYIQRCVSIKGQPLVYK